MRNNPWEYRMNFSLKLIVASYTNSTFMHECIFVNIRFHLALNQNLYKIITYYGGSISRNILKQFQQKILARKLVCFNSKLLKYFESKIIWTKIFLYVKFWCKRAKNGASLLLFQIDSMAFVISLYFTIKILKVGFKHIWSHSFYLLKKLHSI